MRTYAVIGAGLAGAAVAWRLAAAGHATVVLERTAPANDHGSSHGSARIFRYAYPDAFYAGLVDTARADWDELEALADERLITRTGCVDFGDRRHPSQLAEVLDGLGVAHELLWAEAAQERWPQIAFDGEVLWHPGAGVIDAERATLAMLDQARRHGAVVEPEWDVAGARRRGARTEIVSRDGRRLAVDHVVVAAGGWLPDLLDVLDLPRSLREAVPALTVRQEQAFHFPYLDPMSATPWPAFIQKSHAMQVYGLPGGRDAGFRGQKVAEYNGGRTIRSAAEQDGLVDPGNRARVVDFARRSLPGLEPSPYAETTCLFTNTPTEDFVVDGADGVTIVSACSGHGAKFMPTIGRIAADLATGVADPHARFRIVPR